MCLAELGRPSAGAGTLGLPLSARCGREERGRRWAAVAEGKRMSHGALFLFLFSFFFFLEIFII